MRFRSGLRAGVHREIGDPVTPCRDPQNNFDRFQERYSPERSRAARKLERIALGHDVGLQGYTTVEQADILGKSLRLDSDCRLLDVGAGRGWPGMRIARAAGCRLLSTDIPWAALLQAKARAHRESCQVLAADGRALPFCSNSIDAIVHADVFC